MKLYYFDLPGKAECIRLLLTHAGLPFEDIRFTKETWPQYKDKFELKQVPVLEIEGKKYCQSLAILEFLGKKYGYLPKKDFSQVYKIMKIISTCEDLRVQAYTALAPTSPLSEEDKAKALDKVINNTGPVFLGSIEKALEENKCKEFIVGRKYTIADFFLLGFYRTVKTIPDWNKHFFHMIVEKHPALYTYLEKRMKDFNHYYKVCKPKLHYFDAAGRAEMIRMILKYLKIDFEDIRYKFEEWPAAKATGKFELGQVPMLECEVCGFKLCQTDAIMQRIGTHFRMFPDDPEKAYKVLWWCDTAKDIMEGCWKCFLPIPEDKKKELMKNYFENVLPTFFQAMEDRLKSNKSQCCLVGRSITIADFYVMGLWRACIKSDKFTELMEIVKKYPVLYEYCEKKDKIF